MDTIHDLYTFAAKHRIEMRQALSHAGLGPNWASRVRSGRTERPHPKKFDSLRRALFDIAIENGTMPAGIDSPEQAGQVGAAELVRGEVTSIRESLAKIEAVAGGL